MVSPNFRKSQTVKSEKPIFTYILTHEQANSLVRAEWLWWRRWIMCTKCTLLLNIFRLAFFPSIFWAYKFPTDRVMDWHYFYNSDISLRCIVFTRIGSPSVCANVSLIRWNPSHKKSERHGKSKKRIQPSILLHLFTIMRHRLRWESWRYFFLRKLLFKKISRLMST